MKRLCILAFLLLALAVPAWGVARTLYPAHDAMNWSAAEWSLADDNAKNQAKPAAGELDTVYFTENAGDVTLDENSAALASFSMFGYTGTLALGTNTLTVDGVCYLNGTITGTAGATIDAGEGHFLQYATVSDAIVFLLTTSGSHSIHLYGTGGSFNINCAGAYLIEYASSSYALTITAGTLTDGCGQAWTVGAGGFTFTNGTIYGTFDNVDLSGAAGVYTQTAGTVAADAVLNVTTGSGGFTCAAITMTGSVNVTQAVTAAAVEWNALATPLTSLTVNVGAEATLANNIYTEKCVNNGTLTVGVESFLLQKPTANDFWSGSGTLAGTSANLVVLDASRSNAAAIVWDSPMIIKVATNGAILTASGGMDCGALTVYGPNTAGQWGGLTLPDGASLSCADLTLGEAATDRSARVTLGPGVHKITGAIAVAGNGNAQAFSLRGRLILGGTFTGTSITVTTPKEGEIDCFGVGIVTDVTATGRRLVVRRAVDSVTGIPVRSWNGDSVPCTNVRFLPRKVIGAPGVN